MKYMFISNSSFKGIGGLLPPRMLQGNLNSKILNELYRLYGHPVYNLL